MKMVEARHTVVVTEAYQERLLKRWTEPCPDAKKMERRSGILLPKVFLPLAREALKKELPVGSRTDSTEPIGMLRRVALRVLERLAETSKEMDKT